MSTNDDSPSHRARRADPGDRRGPVRQDRDDRWEQSSPRDRRASDLFQDERARDRQPEQRAGYSNFSRSDYPNADPNPSQPQTFYQPPPQRNMQARYEPPAGSYTPPTPPYEVEPSHPGFHDLGRNDLFEHDVEPIAFGHDPYAPPSDGYQDAPFEQVRRPQSLKQAFDQRDEPHYLMRDSSPAEDFDRLLPPRQTPDAQTSRFAPSAGEPQKPAMPQARAIPSLNAPSHFANTAYSQHDDFEDHFEDEWDQDHEHAHPEIDRLEGNSRHDLDPDSHDLDDDFFSDDELDADVRPEPKRSRKVLMLATLVGAMVVGGGGAYLYKAFSGATGQENATPFIRADNAPLKQAPASPGGKQFPNGEKTIYDRLTPEGQQVQSASYAATPMPATASTQPGQTSSLEDRIDEALKRAQEAGNTQQPAAPSQASGNPDQPTVVRSESYRPDGTRVETNNTASFAGPNGGQLPPPFGTTSQDTAPAQPLATPFQTIPVQTSPSQPLRSGAPAMRSASITPADPASAPTGNYWVSLKSAPDERAIQRDLTILTERYKSVLGDVQLSSKIADLGAKGVHYRAVAGPFNSRQEAAEFCQKIKSIGGDKACFVPG